MPKWYVAKALVCDEKHSTETVVLNETRRLISIFIQFQFFLPHYTDWCPRPFFTSFTFHDFHNPPRLITDNSYMFK